MKDKGAENTATDNKIEEACPMKELRHFGPGYANILVERAYLLWNGAAGGSLHHSKLHQRE